MKKNKTHVSADSEPVQTSLACPTRTSMEDGGGMHTDRLHEGRTQSWTENELTSEAAKGGADEGVELMKGAEPEETAVMCRPPAHIFHAPSPVIFWEMASETSPHNIPQDLNQHGYSWANATPPTGGRNCPSSDVLKVGVSLMTSAFFFPFLVWGGFVFLPFDAPLMDSAALRLVYVLRCSVFAAAPIVLGWLVLGVSRFRSGVIQSLLKVKGVELQNIGLHRCFLSDSASLFLVYVLHLVVMAMYLSQEKLKLVPLLTIVFGLGRLAYWFAAAFGSSIRGFGFGLSFLPSVVMMATNIYFLFTVEVSASVFQSLPPSVDGWTPPAARQRFWG